MNPLTRRAVAAHIRVSGLVTGAFDRIERDDRGQGSVEYVGIILVVVAIIGIVIGAATPIGNTIVDKLKTAVSGLG